MEQQQAATPALDLRWTFSNALSALRMVLVLPMAYTISERMRWISVAICVLAAVTDVLDGYLARRNNEISDLGKILDPLADKVFVGVLVILLLTQGMLPVWFVAVVLGRDLLILVGGLLVERRTGQVLPSNYPGKIAVLILSTTLMVIIIGVPQIVVTVMMAASLALLALSSYLYGKRAGEILKSEI